MSDRPTRWAMLRGAGSAPARLGCRARRAMRAAVVVACLAACAPLSAAEPGAPFADAAARTHLDAYCVKCHRQGQVEGEIRLDLPFGQMRELDWHKVVQVLHHSDMPPEKSAQPGPEVRRGLVAWAQGHLDRHVLARAGDPGAVAWRRLTSIELDNAVRDLVGHPFPASRRFPTENFGGEGFSNVGNIQGALSGPVLDKYLATAEEIAKHARFEADGRLVFDPPDDILAPEVRRDRTLVEIKRIGRTACGELYLGPGRLIGGEADERTLDGDYKKASLNWKGPGAYLAGLWLARSSKDPPTALARIAAARGVNPVYLGFLHRLSESCPAGSLEEAVWVEPLRRLPRAVDDGQPVPDDVRAACDAIGGSIASCLRRAQGGSPKTVPGTPAVVGASKSTPIRFALKPGPAPKTSPATEAPRVAHLALTIGRTGRSAGGVGPEAGAVVLAGLPTLHVRSAQKKEATTIVLAKEDVAALPAGATWKEHAFEKDKPIAAVEATRPGAIVFDLSRHLHDVPQEGLGIEVVVPVARSGAGRAFVRAALDRPTRFPEGPDGDVVWLAADPEQEAALKAEWAALFERWFPPHPLTIAPFDNRGSFGLPDEVQFFRDDRRMQRQLLDEPGRRRMDDLWAYLDMLSGESRLRLDVFCGKQQIADLDEAARLAALEGRVARDLDHPYGEIPRAPAARLRFYREEMARLRTLWRKRTLDATLDFAARAWRRPPTSDEAERFARRLDDLQPAADQDVEGVLRTMLVRVLVSPHFLFRCERTAPDGKESRLDAWELATRLSLFLWASLPDDELRRHAADGSLLRDEVLRAQARRMLADPKARGLAEHFFGQWLGFAGFDRGEADPDRGFFPDFTPQVRASLHREAVVFFEDLIRNDRDVRQMVESRHSFLDATLRRYYGFDKDVPVASRKPGPDDRPAARKPEAELHLWLDASDASTVVRADGKVVEWRDKSGRKHHLLPPEESLAPEYSPKGFAGRPAVAFDRHILHHPERRFAYDTHTIVVVARADRTADAHDLVGTGDTTFGHVLLMLYRDRFRGHHWSAGVAALDSQTPASTAPTIYVQYDDGETLSLRRNGTEDASVPLKPVINTAMRPFILGHRSVARQGTFVGQIAEVLVFSGCLSKAELLRIEGRLAHKWGLAAALPSDHPHKTAPQESPLLAPPAEGAQESPSGPVAAAGIAVDDEFLRTDMSSAERGGVLGLGAILVRNSRTRRTSPVNRGLWVVENLLGQHLPPPPANVPPIPDAVESDQGRSLRRQMVMHRENPACAACHVRIDPYGFAFEAFDAAGRLRSADVRRTIEYETTRDGVLLDGLEPLRTYLRKRSDDVERNLVRRMLGYALSRPVAVSDFPLVDRTLAELPANGHRLSGIVERIVLSRQFRARRAADEREFAETKSKK